MKGYPDYATPYGGILEEIGYTELMGRYSGSVIGGSYGDLTEFTVPAGYDIQMNFCSTTASGCQAYHKINVYVNGGLIFAIYFQVDHWQAFTRYRTYKHNEVVVARLYNYGDETTTYECFYGGILIPIATEAFSPQLDPGVPPELKEDETLFLVETPWDGKVWQVVKNIPIPEKGWERHHPPLYLPREVR